MAKRVGILTGGGDAPGLNAVIRAVVLTANGTYGWEVIGIREGFNGLLSGLEPIPLDPFQVRDLLARGGTILGAANRGNPFAYPIEQVDGSVTQEDRSKQVLECMANLELDALIVAGGDGTMSIAHGLHQMGMPVVGVPKTIDNDLGETDTTFGFDTAIQTATEALEKLQTTAESHHRIMVLELMGRDAGWITLFTGIAGGADVILIPEIPYRLEVICQKIRDVQATGRRYSLVVIAEGAHAADGEKRYYIDSDRPDERRLGGIGHEVGAQLADCIGAEVRVTVLGHVQRGGQPTPRDRYLATAFGTEAVHLVAEEKWGHMVALKGLDLVHVPLEDAVKMKFVDPNGRWVTVARDLGIVFG